MEDMENTVADPTDPTQIEAGEGPDLDEPCARCEELAGQLAAVTAERDALQAQVDKAAALPKAKTAAAPKKARKCGPIGKSDDSDRLTPAELLELIQAASMVEVVFSDGQREIADLAALAISGDAWKLMSHGLKLNLPELELIGPQGTSYHLAGYGLFLDGQQAAWGPCVDPYTIGGGRRYNIRDDVFFPG